MKRVLVLLLALLVAASAFASGAKEQAAKEKKIGGAIAFWTFLDPKDPGPRSVVQQKFIQEFEQKYNAKVDVIYKNWAEIPNDFIRAVSGGTAPDVTRLSMPKGWQLMLAADTIAPLSDYTEFTEADKKDWLLDWNSTVKDGKKYSLPIEHRFMTLWLNPEHMAKIGATPPISWEDLRTKAVKLSQMGNVGYAIGIGRLTEVNGLMEFFDCAYYGLGKATVDGKGYATWGDTDEAVKVMETLKKMVDTGAVPKEVLAWSVDDSYKGFVAGKVSIVNYGTQRVFTAIKSGMKPQIVAIPGFKDNVPSPAYTSGWHLVMAKTSKNPATAAEFCKYMTSTEAQIENARLAGEMPSRISPYKDPWFATDPNGKEMMVWQELLFKVGASLDFFEDWLNMRYALSDAAQEIILKNAPIKETLKKHADIFNKAHAEIAPK